MTLVDCLRKSAETFGDKIAVRCRDKCITYSALDIASDKIADSLLEKGMARGKNVGVFMDKSINAVAAILGILKAGCAYVPLDVQSPPARTRYIINDSRLDAVFVETPMLPEIMSPYDGRNRVKYIYDLSEEKSGGGRTGRPWYISRKEIEEFSGRHATGITVSANDTAYILYTSGSTGDPKGVVLSHKNALAFVDWAIECFGINSSDVLSSHAPFHFDLSIFDIYTALKTGAELCLVCPGLSCFPASLVDFIDKNKITVWYSVPSIIVQMILHGGIEKKDISSLRLVAYAGEVFPYKYLNRLRMITNKIEIVNLYGLTETNVITFYRLGDPSVELSENVPVGMPCPYADIRIVDSEGNPVKEGEEGELIVAGDSVMAGYMGDDERTRQVMRTVRVDGAERTYLFTGDMVLRRNDGNIVYKHRKDSIKKIRGNRVDLAEVQAVLYKNNKVKECAVACIMGNVLDDKLKAFVVLHEGQSCDEKEIRRFCGEMVPAYMIPEIIEFRKDLPKTSTGKTDISLLVSSADTHEK